MPSERVGADDLKKQEHRFCFFAFQTASLLCQRGIDFLVEFAEIGFADVGFEDFAFFADKDGSRINLCAERLSDSFVRIIHDGKRQTVVFDILADAFYRIDGLGDGKDLEVFVL